MCLSGTVGQWIGNHGFPAQPLWGILETAHKDFIKWIDHTRAAFKQLKESLMKAPALDLPDCRKSFELFTYK